MTEWQVEVAGPSVYAVDPDGVRFWFIIAGPEHGHLQIFNRRELQEVIGEDGLNERIEEARRQALIMTKEYLGLPRSFNP